MSYGAHLNSDRAGRRAEIMRVAAQIGVHGATWAATRIVELTEKLEQAKRELHIACEQSRRDRIKILRLEGYFGMTEVP